MLNSFKFVVMAAALAVAGVSVAVGTTGSSVPQAATMEQTLKKAQADGKLSQVASGYCSNVDALAAALINAGVSSEEAIGALKTCNVSDAKIASALTAAIPSNDVAALTNLSIALADAGITPTAAGPNAGGAQGGAGPATGGATPFTTSSGSGGGGGGSTASPS